MELIVLKAKKNTKNSETIELAVPDEVRIPMQQGECEKCIPDVTVGQRVYVGDTVGRPPRDSGVPVHSGVSGIVTEIAENDDNTYVVIKTDGLQNVSQKAAPPVISSRETLIAAVRASGLCGQSGAGIPTYKKLATEKTINTLIINACECEPYITADHREIMENTDDIKTGAELLTKYLGLQKCFFALSKGEKEAAEKIRGICSEITGAELKLVKRCYPNGSDKVLAYDLTKRRIKAGQTPDEQGLLILNISTVGFIGRYAKTGMPLVKRRVTIDGSAVRTPCNVMAIIGTPVSKLLEFADCRIEAVWHIVSGGPMMGKELAGTDTPFTKTMNSIIASTEPIMDKKYKEANRLTNCIRCGSCIEACPMKLMPNELEAAIDKGNTKKIKKLGADICIECGACSYVCPAKRDLSAKIAAAKNAPTDTNAKEGDN